MYAYSFSYIKNDDIINVLFQICAVSIIIKCSRRDTQAKPRKVPVSSWTKSIEDTRTALICRLEITQCEYDDRIRRSLHTPVCSLLSVCCKFAQSEHSYNLWLSRIGVVDVQCFVIVLSLFLLFFFLLFFWNFILHSFPVSTLYSRLFLSGSLSDEVTGFSRIREQRDRVYAKTYEKGYNTICRSEKRLYFLVVIGTREIERYRASWSGSVGSARKVKLFVVAK